MKQFTLKSLMLLLLLLIGGVVMLGEKRLRLAQMIGKVREKKVALKVE